MKSKLGYLKHDIDPVDHRPLEHDDDRMLMEKVAAFTATKSPELREAMRELWYRLHKEYLRWICRWCRHEARDVLDTAYLLCIKDAKEWLKDNRVTFKRYSTRRVNRAIQQAYRQQGKPVMEFQNRADHRGLSVEAMVMNRELTDVLAAAMCELPERERRIFDARHVVGLSRTDIAKNERCTVKTVNKHLSSACRNLQTRLSMSGFNYSLTGVAMLLVCNANSEAGEMRLERLIDAAPAITSGELAPAEAMSPLTEALYLGSMKGGSLSSLTWWMATGLTLAVIPITIGLAFWYQSQENHAKVAAPAVVSQPPEPIDVKAIPAVAKSPKVRPGGFPENPASGQIHTVAFDQLGMKIDFCWVPGDGNEVSGVWMTRTEMTQGQWKPVGILAASEVDPTNPSGFRGDDLPIESITSEQAESYAERLSELTGVVVRIPTSAEWQHAAAGGATGPFQQMEEAELEKVAWYEKNSGPTTHPVGTKEPNAYNISDIFGNVFELVSVAPGSYEIRGGCWCYKDFWCTPDYPSLWPANKKEQGVGLRLVHQPATD